MLSKLGTEVPDDVKNLCKVKFFFKALGLVVKLSEEVDDLGAEVPNGVKLESEAERNIYVENSLFILYLSISNKL